MRKKVGNNPSIRTLTIQEQDFRGTAISLKPFLILRQAHDSANAFLKAFDIIRKRRRGGHKGGTTDEEQDLLRSVLVTAATGLDAMIKQIIKDCLLELSKFDELVMKELTKFTENQLKNFNNKELTSSSYKFLARILAADSQKNAIVAECIEELTSGSLQSAGELVNAMNMLGLNENDTNLDIQRIKLIFDIRNKIIHELDINFNAPKRKRNVRSRPRMIRESNILLEIAENILKSVKNRICKKTL